MTFVTSMHASYDAVITLFHAHTGVVVSPIRRAEAEAGIRRAMAKARISDAAEFHRLLIADRHALDELAIELTVGETYFFREPGQFNLIRQRILPDFLARRPAGTIMRAWSAGCATGEEAYSLAILFEQEGLAVQAQILATDISRASIAAARKAVYPAWSLREDDGALAASYFRRRSGRFVLADRFRDRVRFEHLNLALDSYPSLSRGTAAMDLILCRNVLIYFDADTVGKVAARLYGSLAPGGWLVAGPSDPPLWDHAPFEVITTAMGLLYRRPGGGMEAPRTASFAPMSRLSSDRPIAPAPRETPRREHRSKRENSGGTDVGAILARAREALATGDPAPAIALSQDLPDGPEACVLQIRALADAGRLAEAAETAAAAAVVHPLNPEIHYLHGVLLLGLGRYQEAAAATRRVIYVDRSLAVAHLTLGAILRQCGALEGARRAFRNGYELCALRPADEIVPLSDGERAGRLAEAAKAQLELLDTITDDNQ